MCICPHLPTSPQALRPDRLHAALFHFASTSMGIASLSPSSSSLAQAPHTPHTSPYLPIPPHISSSSLAQEG